MKVHMDHVLLELYHFGCPLLLGPTTITKIINVGHFPERTRAGPTTKMNNPFAQTIAVWIGTKARVCQKTTVVIVRRLKTTTITTNRLKLAGTTLENEECPFDSKPTPKAVWAYANSYHYFAGIGRILSIFLCLNS